MMYVKLFYMVLEISIKSSVLIGAILLIKNIFGEKLGAKNQYFLWFLLIIRLILPNINLKFFNIFSKINPYNDILGPNYIMTKAEVISWLNNELSQQDFNVYNNFTLFSLNHLLPTIWLLGMLILILYLIISNIKYRHLINNSKKYVGKDIKQILSEGQKRLNIDVQLKAYKSSFVYSPCLYGFFKPYILLPKNIEEKIDIEELKYVIAHELAHYKRKDIFIYMLIYILQIIYWFNPIIWYGLFTMKSDCEIACDALTLSYFGKDEKENYGLCIIHLLEENKPKLNTIITTKFINTKKTIKRRIIMIKNFKKGSYKVSFIAILLFTLMVGIFLNNRNIEVVADNYLDNSNNEVAGDNYLDDMEDANKEEIVSEDMLWPTPGFTDILAPFGNRVHPSLKVEKMHTGIDIPGKDGGTIIAASGGKVVLAELYPGYGETIIIDHGDGLATLYAHCSELLVKEDDEVTSGTAIAKIGKTGMSSGPHLHFEVRKDEKAVDPLDYVNNK